MAEFFQIIELQGSAFEMGLQHGKALKNEIRANLTLYFDMVKGLTGTDPAVYLAETGQLGKIGFNQHGLGVTLNILMTGEISYGIPVHVLLRMVLGTRTVVDAASLIKGCPRGGTSHLLIGDAGGDLQGFEMTPFDVAELAPENGGVIHTNHYCDAVLAQKDVGRHLMIDSMDRFDRAVSLVAGRKQWDVQGLYKLFSDRIPGYDYGDWHFENDRHWAEAAKSLAASLFYEHLAELNGLEPISKRDIQSALYTYYSAFEYGWMPHKPDSQFTAAQAELVKISERYGALERPAGISDKIRAAGVMTTEIQ